MALNLKIVIIGVIVGVLVVGGAGYFYFSQVRKAETPKEDITKVTGDKTGKVEILGGEGAEKGQIPEILSKLREKIEVVRLRGSAAPEPISPEAPKPGEEIAFKPAVPVGEKPSDVKVFENKVQESGIPGPEPVEKSSFPLPSQFSSAQEYKNALAKKYTSSHIASLKKLQESLIAKGNLKESDRSEFRNEKEINDFWRKYFVYLAAYQDLSPDDREKFLKVLNNPLTQIRGIGAEGYSGGDSTLPVASSIADSIASRLEFSASAGFSEEEIVRHFYPVFYLNGLSLRQEDLVNIGFIKPAEKVMFKTRKEVEWLNLKIIDYEFSKGNLTAEEKANAVETITIKLVKDQQTELDNITAMLRVKGVSSGGDSKKFSFSNLFGNGLLTRLTGLFSFLKPIFKDFVLAGNIFFGFPQAFAWGEIDVDDFCITGPNINLTNWEPNSVDDSICYNSMLYEGAPYKADDLRACFCWSKKMNPCPGVPKGSCFYPTFKCDGSYKDFPPSHCDIPGPGWIIPTNRCFALKTCIRGATPTVEPTGCYIFCPLNLIWDKLTNFCGCAP